MESYIRMKHPLAVTKPIFFPVVVLWLPQAYSDGFLDAFKHILDTLEQTPQVTFRWSL